MLSTMKGIDLALEMTRRSLEIQHARKIRTPEEIAQDKERRASILAKKGWPPQRDRDVYDEEGFRAPSLQDSPLLRQQEESRFREVMGSMVLQYNNSLNWTVTNSNSNIIIENIKLVGRFPIVTVDEAVAGQTCIVLYRGKFYPRHCDRGKVESSNSNTLENISMLKTANDRRVISEKDSVLKAAAILNCLRKLSYVNSLVKVHCLNYCNPLNYSATIKHPIQGTLNMIQDYMIVPDNLVKKVPKRHDDDAYYIIKVEKDGSYEPYCVNESKDSMDQCMGLIYAHHAASALNLLRKLMKPRRKKFNF